MYCTHCAYLGYKNIACVILVLPSREEKMFPCFDLNQDQFDTLLNSQKSALKYWFWCSFSMTVPNLRSAIGNKTFINPRLSALSEPLFGCLLGGVGWSEGFISIWKKNPGSIHNVNLPTRLSSCGTKSMQVSNYQTSLHTCSYWVLSNPRVG